MIRFAPVPALLSLLAASPLAAQDARDFQLPPAGTPTANPRAQGPVDTDGPVPVAPRVIATDRPARATPTPTPTPTPVPTGSRAPSPAPSAAPSASPPRPRANATPTPPIVSRPAIAPAIQNEAPLALEPTPAPLEPRATPTALANPSPTTVATSAPTGNSGSSTPVWLWIALVAAAAIGLIGLLLWRWRGDPREAPAIVVPRVAAPAAGEALALKVEAVKLDRSMMNATVGYRITLRNRTAQPLSNVAIEADLVSANREHPPERQLASPAQALTPRHHAARLGPGQSQRFEGQVQLPLSQANAIWQGQAALLVPLLRVRVLAEEAAPVATTLVIGQSDGQAARPQPFRLDEPPRSYAPLAQRVLDATPVRA